MVSGANTTDYVLDGQNVVRTLLNGAVDRTYLHGPRGPEYERVGNNAPTWYLYDGLGSVLGTVDQSGNVTSARKYDVYGAVRQLTGQNGTRHKFVGSLGHPSDDETGLIYMRARHYDPTTGRFISEDPAGDGSNWYIYASNDPVSTSDYTGKFVSIGFGSLGAISSGSYDANTVGVAAGALGTLLAAIAFIQSRHLAAAGSIGISLVKGADENTGKNQAENDEFDRIADELGLNKAQRRRLHGDISRKRLTPEEIAEIASDMLESSPGKQWTRKNPR